MATTGKYSKIILHIVPSSPIAHLWATPTIFVNPAGLGFNQYGWLWVETEDGEVLSFAPGTVANFATIPCRETKKLSVINGRRDVKEEETAKTAETEETAAPLPAFSSPPPPLPPYPYGLTPPWSRSPLPPF